MNIDMDFTVGHVPDPSPRSKGELFIDAEFASLFADIRSDLDQRIEAETTRIGQPLQALLVMSAVAADAVNWITDQLDASLDGDDEEDKVFARYHLTVTVLAQRAITITQEIHALLASGFTGGAWARLRTLEELFVVAGLIAVFGGPDASHPDLVERYLEHHRVFARGLAQELIEVGNLPADHALSPDVLESLEAHRDALVEKYGREYRTLWGWAATLFDPGTKITFGKLSQKLGLNLAAYNSLASRHVHSSSEGWHEAISVTDDSNESDLVLTFASAYLRMLAEMVVPYVMTTVDGQPNTVGTEWNDALYALSIRARG